MKPILLAEDDSRLAAHWQSLLEEAGHRVTLVSSAKASIDALDSERMDLVIADMTIGSSRENGLGQGGLEMISYIALTAEPLPAVIGELGQTLWLGRLMTFPMQRKVN